MACSVHHDERRMTPNRLLLYRFLGHATTRKGCFMGQRDPPPPPERGGGTLENA